MPVVIEELTTTVQLEDEIKVRQVVREEIEHYLNSRYGAGLAQQRTDPTDPAASGKPNES